MRKLFLVLIMGLGLCSTRGMAETNLVSPVSGPLEGQRNYVDVPFVVSFFPGISIPAREKNVPVRGAFHIGLLGTYQEAQSLFSYAYGPVNIVRDACDGFQSSSGVAYAGSMDGFQGAGLANWVVLDMNGFQGAGTSNYVGGGFNGFQGAGAANIVMGNSIGFQGAGAANIVMGDASGFQGAGAMNLVKGTFSGLQAAGVLNVARTMNGCQMGLINISDEMNGCNFGIINFSRKTHGPSFGLLNIMMDGIFNVSVIATEAGSVNLEVIHGMDYLYNIYSTGYYFDLKKRSAGLGLGTRKKLGGRCAIGLEITSEIIVDMDGQMEYDHMKGRDWEHMDASELENKVLGKIGSVSRAKIYFTFNIAKYFAIKTGFSYNTSIAKDPAYLARSMAKNEFAWSEALGKAWPGFFIGMTF